MSTAEIKEPCGNKNCDKCDPRPRWRISEHRVQHLTYEREIKAATAEEALRIFETGTAWPSQYDDRYGEIVQQSAPVIKQVVPEDGDIEAFRLAHYHDDCCYHDLQARIDAQSAATSTEDSQPLATIVNDTVVNARISGVWTHMEILKQHLAEVIALVSSHESSARNAWLSTGQHLEPLRAAIEQASERSPGQLHRRKQPTLAEGICSVEASLAELGQRILEAEALFRADHPIIANDARAHDAWLEAQQRYGLLRTAIESAQKRSQGDEQT